MLKLNQRSMAVLIGTAYLAIAFGMSFYTIPNTARLFTDLLPGQALPWPTRILVSIGSAPLFAFAVVGCGVMILSSWRLRASRLQNLMIILLTVVMAFAMLGVLWPLIQLLHLAQR